MKQMKGFGLISLLLGIAVIALIAVFILPRTLGVPEGFDVPGLIQVNELGLPSKDTANAITGGRAYDAVRISHLKQFQVALELYFVEWGLYPATGGVYVDIVPNGQPCLTLMVGGYLKTCLTDPSGEAVYRFKSDGETFSIEAVLEQKDSDFCEKDANGECIHTVTEVEFLPSVFDENL